MLALLPLGMHAQNVAQYKDISASGPLVSGNPVGNINDGSASTFTHPLSGTVTAGFHYDIDFGKEESLHRISVINRSTLPERLTNYQLTLYADNAGTPGAVLWEANIRADGTNSGAGGTDLVYANASTNPAHVFRGRFLRLTGLSGADTNPQVAELQAWIASSGTNVARGRPVVGSGSSYPSLPLSNVTDGNLINNSITHPADGVATLGFYYQVDLGTEYALNRVVLYNRTNCCADRLSNYRVTLHADNGGVAGAVLWQADIRTDGSNSGLGGSDTIVPGLSSNPSHVFRGRFVRVTNLSGNPSNPQIAELEAFPEPPPSIGNFLTSAGNIGGAGLPASATLSWSVQNADSVMITGIGTVPASGSLTVTPANTTIYTLVATRAGAVSAAGNVTVAVNAPVLAPRITEFQASDGLLEDEDGERPDWIELHNPNSYTFVLTNYTLTDVATLPEKWTFPLANIPPGGYLIVFASGNDRRAAGSPLHTNFSLSNDGEYLALRAPDGSLIQQYPATYPSLAKFPKQFDRVSYGLDTNGATKFFRPSTPGAANGAGFDGVVADTNFSVKRGIFNAPQSVAISTTTTGATIRYTTDGSEPTESTGTVYGGPINVTTTTVLRAAAFKSGLIPTNVDTNTYIFPAAVVASPVMSTTITQNATYGPQMQAALTDLPSFSLVTPATIAQDISALCSLEYIPTTGAGLQETGGVELFGGIFTNFAKKNFRVSFKSEFGATKMEVPGLFANHARGWKPIEQFDALEFRSGSHDMAMRGFYMSNIFTDGTMLDAGNLNPHGRFVHLYLNGVYWGVYHLRERLNSDTLRAYLGGPDNGYETINGNANVGGWADPGEPTDGDGTAWSRVKSLRTNYAGLRPYLDLQSYIDYMLMFCFGTCEAEYRASGPKDTGSGLKFLLNDADGYLATSAYRPSVAADRFALHSGSVYGRKDGDGPGGIFRLLWVAGNADYRMLLADRVHKFFFNDGVMTAAANQARLSAMCAEMERPFLAESARWLSGGQSRTPATWASERDQTLSWFSGRTATVVSQLQTQGYYPSLAAPAFTGATVASGTSVSFPVASATVYYTTDGSDPRMPGGAVNPAAVSGTSIVVTKNTFLRARSLSGGTWSALNEGFFTVTTSLAAGDVVFSEVHFNPDGDDDAEFIEIWNPTDHAVNLRGAKFTAGLSYDFPNNRDVPLAPGGRLVLASSLFDFQVRYGTTIPVFGVYFDRLGNDGDTLTLTTAANAPLFSLNYTDAAPWPDSADGDGYSLVLTDPANPTAPISYRTSTASGGNPGGTDTGTPFAGAALADADHDDLASLLEHFLATSDQTNGLAAITHGRTVDGRATLTFTRRLSADDLRYSVKVSTDLVNWSATATRASHINHGNGTATETWTANTPSAAQFIRVIVTKD